MVAHLKFLGWLLCSLLLVECLLAAPNPIHLQDSRTDNEAKQVEGGGGGGGTTEEALKALALNPPHVEDSGADRVKQNSSANGFKPLSTRVARQTECMPGHCRIGDRKLCTPCPE